MANARSIIELAFARLAERPGFVARENQLQLAMLVSDCIESGSHGAFEAPTGLGKSLAVLVPSLAHGLGGKRTAISTYTNVLAEQYLAKDLPLALSLLDEAPKSAFLIGRQRYACLAAVEERRPAGVRPFTDQARLGIESEFRALSAVAPRDRLSVWREIAAPPVCPGKICPFYDRCFYYKARREAESAAVVVTNHSVVLQDAIAKRAMDGGAGLLGKLDFLVIDEAHDLPASTYGALEFELSEPRLSALVAVAARLESAIAELADRAGTSDMLHVAGTRLREAADLCRKSLKAFGASQAGMGVLAAAPQDVEKHPIVQARRAPGGAEAAQAIASQLADAVAAFSASVRNQMERWNAALPPEEVVLAKESIRAYTLYIQEYADGCRSLLQPTGVSVSYASPTMLGEPMLRHDVVGIAEPLRDLLWSQTPAACLSATLALDGSFDFYQQITGFEPAFSEILDSPFDYSTQCALYLPPRGTVPDPANARQAGIEPEYWGALARELDQIITTVGGRTLALFHSRKEMEAVFERMPKREEYPILMQRGSGAASSGERFKRDVPTSLFGVRSFWTGFDAPGETLSCVVLVRIPFEVPIDPSQVARQAWLTIRGEDPFQSHSLPMAKMMIRQGAGRLIRSSDDHGVLAILDPRVATKRYGEQILANLPACRAFDDIGDAAVHVGVSVV